MRKRKIPTIKKEKKVMEPPISDLVFTEETNEIAKLINIHQEYIERFVNSDKRITKEDEFYSPLYDLISNKNFNREYDFPLSSIYQGKVFTVSGDAKLLIDCNLDWDTRDIYGLKVEIDKSL